MSDTLRFPNGGYDVTVCRKQDILDALDANIVDKEVVLAIITQCEIDATNFLKEGRWTGIPYLGNMRIPRYKEKFKEIGGKEILEDAKQDLDKNKYILFRKSLNANIAIDIKNDRLYRYRTSCFVTKHRKTYTYFLRIAKSRKIQNNEVYARIMCFSFIDLSNYIPLD